MRKLLILIILCFVLSLLLSSGIFAQQTDEIYFLKDNNVWMLDLNTKAEKQLTTLGKYKEAVLSPDKTKIVFMADAKQSEMGLWFGILGVANIDGSNEQKYKDIEVMVGEYVWSPDSTKIAIVPASNQMKQKSFFIVDTAANNVQTNNIEAENIWYPSWSPDGTKIAVRASKSGIGDVLIYDINTKNSELVFESPFKWGSDYFVPPVSWSADGKKITFEVQQLNENETTAQNNIIWLVDLDSSARGGSAVADNPKQEIGKGYTPLFSPKGNLVAFVSEHEDATGDGKIDINDMEIYIYDINSKETKRATKDTNLDRLVAWSADGNKILYNEMLYENDKEIYELCIADLGSGISERLLVDACALDWQQAAIAAQLTAVPTPGPKPVSKKLIVVLTILAILVVIAIIVLIILVAIKASKSMPK